MAKNRPEWIEMVEEGAGDKLVVNYDRCRRILNQGYRQRMFEGELDQIYEIAETTLALLIHENVEDVPLEEAYAAAHTMLSLVGNEELLGGAADEINALR